MARDPGWFRRCRGSRRWLVTGRAHALSPRRRRLGPVLHVLMAVVPLAFVVLLAHGHPVLAVLVVVAVAGLLAGDAFTRRRAYRDRQADREHVHRLVDAVYEDWVRAEARRGHLELDAWRRTGRL